MKRLETGHQQSLETNELRHLATRAGRGSARPDTYAYAYTYPNAYSDSNSDSNSHAYPNTDPDSYANAYA